MNDKNIAIITGFGSFSAILAIILQIVMHAGIAISALEVAFTLTWIYMIVNVFSQRRWDGTRKFWWIAGMLLLAPLIVPYYWWSEVWQPTQIKNWSNK